MRTTLSDINEVLEAIQAGLDPAEFQAALTSSPRLDPRPFIAIIPQARPHKGKWLVGAACGTSRREIKVFANVKGKWQAVMGWGGIKGRGWRKSMADAAVREVVAFKQKVEEGP